jgi:hypothetical protein
MLSHTPKDITEVFEKSNIAWCMNIPKVTTERTWGEASPRAQK